MADHVDDRIETSARRVGLLQLFKVFFKIGATSLGGGSAGWMHLVMVTQLNWLSEEEFVAGVAIAQVLPGVNTTNITVYFGHRLGGWTGALAALCGFLSGPFFVAVLTAVIYHDLLRLPGFDAAMLGVASVALGMVLRVALLSARRCIREVVPTLVMLSAFVSVGVLHWPLALTILILAPISIFAARPKKAARDA